MSTPKETLKRYLHAQRDALLWKAEGLDERDLRWPRTPTGTNLLGLLKHVASFQYEYFGPIFGRPVPEPMPWLADDADDTADLWATADQSKEWVIGFYRRSGEFADRTIDDLDLDAPGRVPWWGDRGDVTLQAVMVHVIAEIARHAGHADIIRETLDGSAGLREGVSNLPDHDSAWWADHVSMLRQVADQVAATSTSE